MLCPIHLVTRRMIFSSQAPSHKEASDSPTVAAEEEASRIIGVVEEQSRGSEVFPAGIASLGFEHRRLRTVPPNRLGREDSYWSFSQLMPEQQTDLVHAINTIPLNAKRFVLVLDGDPARQSEAAFQRHARLGERIFRSPSCRAILARSELAKDRFISYCNSSAMEDVSAKVSVYRGFVSERRKRDEYSLAQSGEALESELPLYPCNETKSPIRAIFVADDAFGMGLPSILDVCESMRAGGVEIHLTVTSSLRCQPDPNLLQYAPLNERVAERIRACEWIRQVSPTSSRRLRSMFAAHHLLLMPAFTPSSGWQIAAAAMEGCLSITTNVHSLPELVDDEETGFIADLPLDDSKRWIGESIRRIDKQDALIQANKILRDRICHAINSLSVNRTHIRELGMAAQAKIRRMFGNAAATEELKRVYANACR